MMDNFFDDEIEKEVFISREQLEDKTMSQLYGKYFEDTKIYNIFPEQIQEQGDFLGNILDENEEIDEAFCAKRVDGKLHFYCDKKELKVSSYDLYQNIFSRNSGILETSMMQEKRAVILGCGSVGSLVALELARSGVSHFLLCDADILEYHNLCRHQCGIEDVGDLKVNAVKRKIKNINPQAEVICFEGIVQNLPKDILDQFCIEKETIFVGCADNRSADVYANRISIYYKAAFISIGFWERAAAGEIFYHIPSLQQPCYECALGHGSTVSSRSIGNHHVYSNEEDLEKVKFEPGISVDINFVTTIGIKLIIDILNYYDTNYIPRLLNHLKQYTIVCNTNNKELGGDMVEIFSYPLQVSTSLIVGFSNGECKKNGKCKYEMENS